MHDINMRDNELLAVHESHTPSTILKPGRNCWRIQRARRAAFFIDGCDYFSALRAALMRAQHSVLIAGWDFDHQIRLDPINAPDESLSALIARLVQQRPSLHVRILIWGFSTFYGANHQPALLLSQPWYSGLPRVEFEFDNNYPLGSSHHEKVVCIDDAIAFVGGIDLTAERWDTQAHDMMSPRRYEYDGEPFQPVHDLQMAVDGEVARSVSLLVRERWRQATGRQLKPVLALNDPWPPGVPPHLFDVDIAIARTRPPYGQDPGVREVEALNIDALRVARKSIYLETQYFTAQSIGDVLAERLSQPDGPEVIIVVTKESDGLVEQFAMGSNRERLLRRLKMADSFGRLRAYCAVVPMPGGGEHPIGIHSKLAIIDDRFVRIGSSNFNNRSMGADTECDLAIEAQDDTTRRAIASLRNRLLAEHIDTSEDELAEAIARNGSIIAAIEALNVRARRLCPCHIDPAKGTDEPISGTAILDPIEPINLTYLRQVLSID